MNRFTDKLLELPTSLCISEAGFIIKYFNLYFDYRSSVPNDHTHYESDLDSKHLFVALLAAMSDEDLFELFGI